MKGLDIWKNIKGYEGVYQVSYTGEVRKIYKKGKTKKLATYTKSKRRQILFVGLSKDGIKKEYSVHGLVAQAFLGVPNEGQVPYHKNGLIRDNWASNLCYIDRESLGKITGAQSKRKGVVKIDSDGFEVDFYPSGRQAAKENFMSYQTVIDRCNNKVKSPFAPDGFAYAWEDIEISVNQAMRKIKLFNPLQLKEA